MHCEVKSFLASAYVLERNSRSMRNTIKVVIFIVSLSINFGLSCFILGGKSEINYNKINRRQQIVDDPRVARKVAEIYLKNSLRNSEIDKMDDFDATVMYDDKKFEWIIFFRKIQRSKLWDDTHSHTFVIRRDYGTPSYERYGYGFGAMTRDGAPYW